jgi:hypothetical protein
MDVMLSDEAGCLPEQLFLEVVKCLELGAGFSYSSSCQEQAFSEAELPAYPVSRKPKLPRLNVLARWYGSKRPLA